MKNLSKKITKLKPGCPPKVKGGPHVLVIEKDETISRSLQGSFSLVSASDETKAQELLEIFLLQAILIQAEDNHHSALRLCQNFKANEITAAIPVIIMMQELCEEVEIDCLKQGADEVLARTISRDLLTMKIKGVIDRAALPTLHSNFLHRVDYVIQKHLNNQSFNVISLASLLRLDRKTLYRKVSVDSGLTPQLYIRKRRLERGFQLLSDGECSITEVTSRIGFKDVSYFTKCFKQHYGKLPSDCKPCLLS